MWQTLEVHLPMCLGLLVLSKQLCGEPHPRSNTMPEVMASPQIFSHISSVLVWSFYKHWPRLGLTKKSFVCVLVLHCSATCKAGDLFESTYVIDLGMHKWVIFPPGPSCDVTGPHFKRSTIEILPHWQDLPYTSKVQSFHVVKRTWLSENKCWLRPG